MTISNINPYNNYSGNGSATTFDYDFLINDEDELKVELTCALGNQLTLILNTDYSINVDGDGNFTGSITYPIENSTHQILSSDEILSLSLNLDFEQSVEYKNSSKLNLSNVEYSFDYLTRIAQILNRRVDRAVKIQEGSSLSPDEMLDDIKTAQNTCVTSAQTCENAADTILKNVQTDWNETDSTLGTFIKNKPVIPSISNLADKDLSNLSVAGEAKFSAKADIGVDSTLTICDELIYQPTGADTAWATYNLNFLPNDGGVYEVYLTCVFATTSSTHMAASVKSEFDTALRTICAGHPSAQKAGGCCSLFTADRKITFYYEIGATPQVYSGLGLRCYAYRKVG